MICPALASRCLRAVPQRGLCRRTSLVGERQHGEDGGDEACELAWSESRLRRSSRQPPTVCMSVNGGGETTLAVQASMGPSDPADLGVVIRPGDTAEKLGSAFSVRSCRCSGSSRSSWGRPGSPGIFLWASIGPRGSMPATFETSTNEACRFGAGPSSIAMA